jgi:thiol-activated cytolysin
MLKLLSFGTVALLAACSGASDSTQAPDPETQTDTDTGVKTPTGSDVKTPTGSGSGSAEGKADGEVDASGAIDSSDAIDSLVVESGNIDTTLTPGNVATSPTTTVVVPDPTGATSGWSCSETDYSLTSEPSQFVVMNPNADVLWPGSLIQGASLASGVLNPIPVKRAPGTITLTIAGGGGKVFSQTMPEASLSAATGAMNQILAGYTGGTPAAFSLVETSVYSSNQLAVTANVDASGGTWSGSASLAFDSSSAKSHVLIQFSQQFFTMAFQPPQGAAGVFDPSVTAADLAPYVGAGNPPVYVASVTYGRIFYLLFESSASQTDLSAAVSAAYNGGAVTASGSATVAQQAIINNATLSSYGIGGDAQAAIAAASGGTQFDKVGAFLTGNADFSPENPGVPISYMIGDSSEVKLALTTSYTAKDCVPDVVGCDGVVGSGKVNDACGVCGGDGSSCDKPCAAGELDIDGSNGEYVAFHMAAAANGTQVSFPNGNDYTYSFPLCNEIDWYNVTTVCTNGTWAFTGNQSSTSDSLCNPSSNASYSDSSGNSIVTGYN